MPRKIRGQVRLDAHRTDPWTPTPVGNAERLVKIEVADIGSKLARLGHPYERIEIGSIQVHLSASGVNHPAAEIACL